ncbi:MAG: SAM-dependent DNA methyltransferase, partial [Kiritimatiellae bacterium]|nr:SAM-dependent DNA methyltransferase [Kiritimatiellia bacterium]
MTEPISIADLEKYLWGAAVLLRGQIDASGYKEFIFPLLFFKRICDVYDEEFQRNLEEAGGDAEFAAAQDYIIRIPEGAHWRDVRKVTENIGAKLVEAFMRIEAENPPKEIEGRLVGGLTGIFGDKSIWTNKAKMPDAIIVSLLNHFSKETLSIARCPADEMGTGYEYLVGQFANDAGHTAQEFYTNRTVVTLMAQILRPAPGESIYDPTCGSGGMLIKSLDYLKSQGLEYRSVRVYGQEVNPITSAIARMNLYLHGVTEFSIQKGDTLADPKFIRNGRLARFNVVLANPPYSIKTWDREKFAHDVWSRNILGTPPQGRADYAFIQHILASMDETNGRCAILLPHGVLNRLEEREMRAELVKLDWLDCILGIGK